MWVTLWNSLKVCDGDKYGNYKAICSSSRFSKCWTRDPVIYLFGSAKSQTKLEEANYKTIGVNSLLSKALLKYPAENRAGYIESE